MANKFQTVADLIGFKVILKEIKYSYLFQIIPAEILKISYISNFSFSYTHGYDKFMTINKFSSLKKTKPFQLTMRKN